MNEDISREYQRNVRHFVKHTKMRLLRVSEDRKEIKLKKRLKKYSLNFPKFIEKTTVHIQKDQQIQVG